MAAVAVAYDAGSAGRLNSAGDGNVTTGWTSDGATVGAEPDFWYTGSYCVSCLVKTSEVGIYCTVTSTAFNSSPVKVAVLKVIMTNKDSLDGNGIIMRIGSGTGAYYYYNQVFTSSTYPIAGGWQIVPIDPNISGYRSGTTGSPNLGAVVYFAFRGDCAATAKSANFGVDAVDYVTHGAGLTLTGGDGADTDGAFTNFVTFDEGTSTNRYGLVRTNQGILYVFGILTIGTSTATVFTDSNRVLVFPDGRFNTGFSGLAFGLQSATTAITISNCTFIGRGQINGFGGLASGSDTRPVITTTSTSGTASITGCSFQSFNTITLNAQVSVSASTFVSGVKLTPDGATFDGCTFDQPDVANGTAYMDLNSGYYLDDITNSTFNSKGTGHAIEINQTGTHNLVGVVFNSYGTTGTTSAAIYNNSGGSVTINVSGAASPTYYNGTNASTSVVQTINWYFEIQNDKGEVVTSGAEIRIYRVDTGAELFGKDASDGTELYSFSGTLSGIDAKIVVIALDYLYYSVVLTHPSTSNTADAPVILSLFPDRVYKNPT